jgi:hypothetical protein
MEPTPVSPCDPEPQVKAFYVDALRVLDEAGVDYLVGGGYAMAHYTGIARGTKDLDLFVRPCDSARTLEVLAGRGYRTEYFYPFWIAKALCGDAFIDILYNSGNGLCPVDDQWFAHAEHIDVHGYRARLSPAEEQLWSKAFVQDRDRFDGSDVAHLILCRGRRFDWQRLLHRFAGHEPVLLAHLVLFGYIYPTERHIVPKWVVDRLWVVASQAPADGPRLCMGTFVSQRGYGTDLREWGFIDGRLQPHGPLTQEQINQLPDP